MTTKDDLTFSQLKVKLYSLSSNVESRTGTALIARHNGSHGKKRKFDRGTRSSSSATPTSASTQSCTWCKARGFRNEGHVWQECRKLKASKSGSKSQDTTAAPPAYPTNNSAHVAELVTADTYVSYSPAEWKFDTGSSAHMTNDIGQFQQLTSHNGTIRVGGNSILRSEGIGEKQAH